MKKEEIWDRVSKTSVGIARMSRRAVKNFFENAYREGTKDEIPNPPEPADEKKEE